MPLSSKWPPDKNIFMPTMYSSTDYLINANDDSISQRLYDDKSPYIDINKTSNKDAIIEGEEVIYTVKVCNIGFIDVHNVLLIDKLCPSMKFLRGSVVINNTPMLDFTPITGISLGTLKPSEYIIIKYSASLVERPENGKIKTTATMSYEFLCTNGNYKKYGVHTTNNHIITGEKSSILLKGHVDKNVANINDILTYTITLNNNGTLDLSNLRFLCTIPDNLKLLYNSFKLNDTLINVDNLSFGVPIGNLKSRETITLEFKTTVSKMCAHRTIDATYHVKFNYRHGEFFHDYSSCSSMESISVLALSPNFKEITLDNMLCMPDHNPPLEDVVEISAQADIYNYRIVKTLKGISNENKTLTGYKAIVTGILKTFLEYTSKTSTSKVYSTSYESKFSTFLILPEEYIDGTPLELNSFVDAVYYNIMNNRTIFSTISLHIDAKVFY